MLDDLNRAYDRIANRFPDDWPVEIVAEAHFGRRKPRRAMYTAYNVVNTLDFSLHVTAGGVDYCEAVADLDEIERAAEAIIDQIAAADMADPVKSRRGLDRLARALDDPLPVDQVTKAFYDHAMAITERALQRTALAPAMEPASGGTGRAA